MDPVAPRGADPYSRIRVQPIRLNVDLHRSDELATLAAAVQARALQVTLSAARRRLDSTAAHIDALASREAELQQAHARARRELAAREKEIEQLRTSLEMRVEELNQSRADNHRFFQQAPMPMFRCTKHGVLTEANRMLRMLLGRRSAEELHDANLAALTFESPNDLSWLIERCLGSKGKESIETTWQRKDGSRLLARLSARAMSPDLIECGVEDLTAIRVLNDKLSEAHRLESVGRLATEVAVTCERLLGGIHQDAQRLMTDGSDVVSRHDSEMLLEEISRVAGFLRQFAAYGDDEGRSPAVELCKVVRDTVPVLKRIVGDDVEIQVPAACAPLNIDAGAERVKRVLVNLAASARERLPLGGRLKLELRTTVVDRRFAAKHPNVRLGPHALVTATLTESRRVESSLRGAAVQMRVDLGTLQEVVGYCDGHLWMTVEPVGDMIVKIRLPLVTVYGEPARRSAARRVPALARWFQH